MSTYNATRSAVIRSAGLLGLKVGAFLLTGSAVLLAALIDSMVDVVASLIAHYVKPQEHHEQHQMALIQALWIVMGGIIVFVESVKGFNEPVEMALAGLVILVATLAVDATIVRKLSKETNPIIVGLTEDIKADMTNSIGGLIALVSIALGAPTQLDKVIAIIISVALIIKGARFAHENIVEGSEDHAKEHTGDEGGVGFNPTLG